MHRTRKLRALWIDDNTAAPKGELTVDLKVRRNLDEVAKFMIEPDGGRADIVVCDAWMQWGGHPDGLDWGVKDMAAYGPLLALPFLQGSPVCSFIPVSGAWANLRDNGFVRAALALILTKSTGKVQSFDEAREWLERRPTEGVQPRRDIMDGVFDYRERLIEVAVNGEEVAVAGIKEAIELVRGWRPGESLREAHGVPVHIEIISRHGCDRIEVESLFADLLDLQPLTEDTREDLLQGLREMYDAGEGLRFDRESSLYARATALLQDAMPDEDGVKWYRILRRAEDDVGKGEEAYWLVRFAMLFAFLRAIYFHDVSERKYNGAVIPRKGGHTPYDRRDWVYFFTGLDPLTTGVTNYFKRYLGDEIDDLFHVGDGRARRPFDDRFIGAQPKQVLEAYACLLDVKEKGNLTAMEKYLCERFLADDSKFFPSTLPIQDRIVWMPYDLKGQPPYPLWLNW